jgi:hypothetical protein
MPSPLLSFPQARLASQVVSSSHDAPGASRTFGEQGGGIARERRRCDAKGAYGNVLALASTPREYEGEVRRALGDPGRFAFEFEDVEPLAERAAQRSLEADLHVLAAEVPESGQPRLATFHTFANVDA